MLLIASTLSTTLLALVFGASGALKLGSIDATHSALTALGAPRFLRNRPIAAAVPYAELALSIALICAPSPLFTAVSAVAVAVSAVFLLLAARSAGRPEAVYCNCFGSLSAQPIGRATVIRNGILLVFAVITLTFAREGVVPTIAALDAPSLIAYLAVLSLVLVACVALLLTRAARHTTLPSPESSTTFDSTPWPIPDVEVTTGTGDVIPLAHVASHKATLLFLVSAECTPCRYILSSIPAWQQQLLGAVDIALLTSEKPSVMAPLVDGLTVPVYYGYRALLTVTKLSGVPAAFLLTPDRNVSAGPALGSDEIDGMMAAVTAAIVEQGMGVNALNR
ncbi:MauE/DoxX family redox-associated membrane protein [Subtercola endophyticus]|uniref:MauE/DoxX family redox-associated membrane protein n=1 Tax=Subtercola endophyticus TaxID=2895559 RepID=UPI001E577C74|nr:MauE/DoxX family redox-associated membrane protein [Subtercola endophyticus]UFS57840.1 hypothetical protein LQ955_12410 [Subtercola endophyticus]